jgi:predicted transcriptional regulator
MDLSKSTEIHLQLDIETATRLHGLAASRRQPPESILHDALMQYLDWQSSAPAAQPEGKRYPRRHSVGGIITPV